MTTPPTHAYLVDQVERVTMVGTGEGMGELEVEEEVRSGRQLLQIDRF